MVRWSIPKALEHFRQEIVAWTAFSSLDVTYLMDTIRDQVDEHYVTAHGTQLKHGDIIVTVSEGGYGDLFTQIAGLPSTATHTGFVLKYYSEGYPVYAKAEIGANYINYAQFEDANLLVMRPNFEVPNYIGREMIEKLEKLGDYQFDFFFEPGFKPKKGKVRLYCSEFIHFAFKNGFDRKATVEGISPFDDRETFLNFETKIGNRNLRKLGMKPGTLIYPPSLLYYSKYLSFVAYQSPFRFVKQRISTRPSAEQESLQKKLIEESRKEFNQTVAVYFRNHNLRGANYAEQIRYDLFLRAYINTMKQQNQKGGGGPTEEIPTRFPSHRSKYQVMKLFDVTQNFAETVPKAFAEGRTIEEGKAYIAEKAEKTLKRLFRIK